MRVALYARISIDPDPRNPLAIRSAENQLVDLRNFVSTSGWQITGEYVDKVSGSKGVKERIEFGRMFQDASRRKFDLLLFWSLDRFSREGTLKTLKYLEELESYKVNWRSYMEPYLDSAGIFKDVVISIMATLAKQERIRMSERVKVGIKSRQSKGLPHGRPETKIDMKEFQKCIKAGMSQPQLARRFDICIGTVKKLKRNQEATKSLVLA